ncbi:hypothetical protein ES708_30099 [subsurface metagenome]
MLFRWFYATVEQSQTNPGLSEVGVFLRLEHPASFVGEPEDFLEFFFRNPFGFAGQEELDIPLVQENAVSGHTHGPLDEEVVLWISELILVDIHQGEGQHVDHPLQDVLDRADRNIGGIFENHDIPSSWLPRPRQLHHPRHQFRTVDQLVYKYSISDLECRDHRLRRDLISLEQKLVDQQNDDYG